MHDRNTANDEEELERGKALYRAGRDEEALHVLLPLARQGDAEAQVRVADLYSFGNGVKKNDKKAFAWYMKAARGPLWKRCIRTVKRHAPCRRLRRNTTAAE